VVVRAHKIGNVIGVQTVSLQYSVELDIIVSRCQGGKPLSVLEGKPLVEEHLNVVNLAVHGSENHVGKLPHCIVIDIVQAKPPVAARIH
jgi:hypothetical protein